MSLNIRPTIRARRRCVPAALVGYLVSGWLGVLPFGFVLGLLGGTATVSSGMALVTLAFLSTAIAVAIASWSAERASRVGALLENVCVIPFLSYFVYAVHQAGTQLDMLMPTDDAALTWTLSWPLLAIAAVAAIGSFSTLSGLVAAFQYQQLVPAGAPFGPKLAIVNRLHAARFLSSSKGVLTIVHLVAAGVCFVFPAALGITVVERGIRGSSPAPDWESRWRCFC